VLSEPAIHALQPEALQLLEALPIDSGSRRAGRFYCSRRNSISSGWDFKQYCLETCLLEVAIRCQSARNPALFHHQERQTVRDAPILVVSCLIKTHSSGNGVSGEGHNFDLRILVTSPVAFRCRTPCPGTCQRIHPFPQNSLRRENEGIVLDQYLLQADARVWCWSDLWERAIQNEVSAK